MLVVVVSLGLGSIVARSIAVFTAIKLAGAAYMVFLGIRMCPRRATRATMLDATIAPQGLSGCCARASSSASPTRRR